MTAVRASGIWSKQTLLVLGAAQIDPVGLAISAELLAFQLAPVCTGIEATAQGRAGDSELPGQIVGDLVRVHDERWEPSRRAAPAQACSGRDTGIPG